MERVLKGPDEKPTSRPDLFALTKMVGVVMQFSCDRQGGSFHLEQLERITFREQGLVADKARFALFFRLFPDFG